MNKKLYKKIKVFISTLRLRKKVEFSSILGRIRIHYFTNGSADQNEMDPQHCEKQDSTYQHT